MSITEIRSLRDTLKMIVEGQIDEELIPVPASFTYGTNAPDFNNKQVGKDNRQDAMMSFFNIQRDFYYTMFKFEHGYFMVGFGKRENSNRYRLVMAASDEPNDNWSDYSFAKQYKRTGFLWTKRVPKIEKIKNSRGLYGAVGRVAIEMVGKLNPPSICLNGYTDRMTQLFKMMFRSKSIEAEIERLGYTLRISKTWIILSKE